MAKKVRCTFSIIAEIGKKSILEVRWLLPVGIPRSVRCGAWHCAAELRQQRRGQSPRRRRGPMPTAQQVAVPLLVAVLAAADAHVQPTRRLQGHGPKHGQNCSCAPGSRAAESYHIHVMFYPHDAPNVRADDPAGNNPNNAANAAAGEVHT